MATKAKLHRENHLHMSTAKSSTDPFRNILQSLSSLNMSIRPRSKARRSVQFADKTRLI